MNPLKGKMCLPLDCSDIEWEELKPAEPKPKRSFADFQKSVQTVEVLPEPIKFKSLAASFGELVLGVRGHKRLAEPAGYICCR
jgi:hypothetical protein